MGGLLSGLLACGRYGVAYTLVGGQYYGCASARNKGTCNNHRMIRRELLEDRVLGEFRDMLLDPGVIAAFVEEYQREYNAVLQIGIAARRGREAELAKVRQTIARIVDAIADGMYHSSMKEKMSAQEERRTAIEVELTNLGNHSPRWPA